MKTYGQNMYKADNGKHFVLTAKGKTEVASYRNRTVGEPINFGYSDEYCAYIRDVDNGYVEEVDDPEWVILPGYKVVYDHKGYQICAGNPIVFHDLEMAERMRDNFNARSWRLNEPKAYVINATYEGKRPKPCHEYNGQIVYNDDYWFGDVGRPGDLVEEEIAEWIANCVPPKSYSANYIQCGEPSSTKVEGNTYATFVKVAEGIWKYCGNCLKGEREENGTDIPYVA